MNDSQSAPRVTSADIDSEMSKLRYECWIVPGTTTTIAVAVMPDGFSVGVGKSASISKEKFSAEIGEKIAITECERNARDKLWELKGYLLKNSMSGA